MSHSRSARLRSTSRSPVSTARPARGPSRPLRSAVALALLAATATHAAPGDVDVTYAEDGVLFIDGAGHGRDDVQALLALPGGGVVGAGGIDDGLPRSGDMGIVQLTPSGALDPQFGEGGIVLIDGGGDADQAWAMLRQPDGKLVVAGSLERDSYLDFGIVRLNADGSPDSGFGEDDGSGARTGRLHVNTGADEFVHDTAHALARQSDGKLVMAGDTEVTEDGTNWVRFALVRVDADGSVDSAFGSNDDGIVVSPASQHSPGEQWDEVVTAIALRRDGSLPADDRITVVGYGFAGEYSLVRRYLADGQPDTSFDGDGTLVIHHRNDEGDVVGFSEIAHAVLQEDGKLLVTGESGERAFTVMRFHADGRLDTGFGVGGRASVRFSAEGDYDIPGALALQADGRILLAGYFSNPATSYDLDFGVARLLPDGSPDTSFGGGDAVAIHPLSAREDIATALAVLPDGAIVAAGFATPDDNDLALTDMAFLRLQGDRSPLLKDGFED